MFKIYTKPTFSPGKWYNEEIEGWQELKQDILRNIKLSAKLYNHHTFKFVVFESISKRFWIGTYLTKGAKKADDIQVFEDLPFQVFNPEIQKHAALMKKAKSKRNGFAYYFGKGDL